MATVPARPSAPGEASAAGSASADVSDVENSTVVVWVVVAWVVSLDSLAPVHDTAAIAIASKTANRPLAITSGLSAASGLNVGSASGDVFRADVGHVGPVVFLL